MGLYAWEIEKIAALLRPRHSHVISFGHPDILATPKQLRPIVGMDLPIDNAGLDRAGYPKNVVGNARIVFGALGGQMTIVDFRKTYGVDYTINLNYPDCFYDHDYIEYDSFDLAIDPGTSEHCFNVGTALINMARCVKVGGYIYHRVPLCHWNHGFWNFSPCAFHDFYMQNGFEIVLLGYERAGDITDVPTRKDVGGSKWYSPRDGRKWQLVCIAKRVEGREIGFPVQYKYI